MVGRTVRVADGVSVGRGVRVGVEVKVGSGVRVEVAVKVKLWGNGDSSGRGLSRCDGKGTRERWRCARCIGYCQYSFGRECLRRQAGMRWG